MLYVAEDGSLTLRIGGSRPWRTFNPGSLDFGEFAQRHGAIGTDGRLAIFPDYETGRAALSALLHGGSYINLSIYNAIARYAPPDENDTSGYRGMISQFTGLDIDRILNTLNEGEFDSVLDAIQRVEGYIEGETRPLPRVEKTKEDEDDVLTEFLLEGGGGFISLSEAINLASNERLYAVVVDASPNTYIRAFPDETTSNNFDSLTED